MGVRVSLDLAKSTTRVHTCPSHPTRRHPRGRSREPSPGLTMDFSWEVGAGWAPVPRPRRSLLSIDSCLGGSRPTPPRDSEHPRSGSKRLVTGTLRFLLCRGETGTNGHPKHGRSSLRKLRSAPLSYPLRRPPRARTSRRTEPSRRMSVRLLGRDPAHRGVRPTCDKQKKALQNQATLEETSLVKSLG